MKAERELPPDSEATVDERSPSLATSIQNGTTYVTLHVKADSSLLHKSSSS